ncbi:hypothetical protein PYCCODRAFT_918565 [Trametes coccinea BRFM310]|uniref:Uncharacterized protein n=1 Tax=Trametes coccinea (strain BRFM310) TaxID=1353009 RepID=A0A1Y2IER4_TRAC3|nr:hypothetical protein PYCCODRAFT_918565 [Trametes coccinea BRFM310]
MLRTCSVTLSVSPLSLFLALYKLPFAVNVKWNFGRIVKHLSPAYACWLQRRTFCSVGARGCRLFLIGRAVLRRLTRCHSTFEFAVNVALRHLQISHFADPAGEGCPCSPKGVLDDAGHRLKIIPKNAVIIP